VVPLHKALQGHPEAGALWERMIVGILEELGFHSTTHERNLYCGEINGELVLVCRQVDDFAIASKDPKTADLLISKINAQVTTQNKGLGMRYNGIDLNQTRDYIKVSCESFIDRMLQTHGWSQPSPNEKDRHDVAPISSEVIDRLQQLKGTIEGTLEHKEIEKEVGFGYRQVLGELIYAYIVCRIDIGYAVVFLSRFSTAPAKEHYLALKGVCKYLRRTKNWGLVYWRMSPVISLPVVSLEQLLPDPEFPKISPSELVGFVDAAHATDVEKRRSITGWAFCYAGAAIAYKSKLQTVIATSSTEAEFVAAVHAAKAARYLRSILKDLGFAQEQPTILYEDNEAAIAMINQRKPTTRSRHIDVQFFAIQEWREQGDILMKHISGCLNMADDSTKALGWILHHRHARRAMGHHRPHSL